MSRSTSIRPQVPGFNDVVVHALPTKPINIVKAVRTSERVVVMLGETGKVYSTGIRSGFAYVGPHATGETIGNVFRGLVLLGLLTKAALAEYQRIDKQRRDVMAAYYAADGMQQSAERLGVKLSAEQKRKISAALNARAALREKGEL